MEYFAERVKGSVELMDKLDMINRTSELARLFGIQFYEVLSRGSQVRYCYEVYFHIITLLSRTVDQYSMFILCLVSSRIDDAQRCESNELHCTFSICHAAIENESP
jgi:hypothetical protein